MASIEGARKILGRDFYNVAITHVPSRRVRSWWLRRAGMRLGAGACVQLSCRVLDPWNIEIGERTAIGHNSILDGRGGLTIEHDVDVAPHVHIWTLEHDPSDPHHATREGRVRILSHAWLASRSTLLPGTTIGEGAVVAAGAVARRNIDHRAIVAGVPAAQVGQRSNACEYKLQFSGRFR